MVSAQKLLATAKKQVGNRESPDGSNRGSSIRKYGDTTGAYGYPWCVSFCQWVLKQHGVGPIANNTAGVFYLESYARQHGWLRPHPRPGFLVCFMKGQGHIGIVESVSGSRFTTIEGNAGNAVTRRYHSKSGIHHFVQVPGVTQKPYKPVFINVRVPRFRVVTKAKGVPLTKWQTWDSLEPKLPFLLVKHQNQVRLQRKVIKVKKRRV